MLLLILGMTAPLSIDMYLAAFPMILKELQTTPQMLSFTLIGFTVSMAVGMLFIGTISDKFGRKPVLLGSLVLYILGSLGCIFTPNIEFFIASRMLQALGAGGMVSIPMAIVKDSFEGEDRTNMIATLQMFTILGPTIAPILGAYLIKVFPWQASFVVLALIATFNMCLTFCFKETLAVDKRVKGNIFDSILSLGTVLRHKPFMSFLSSTALVTVVFMAYLSVSSYIYIQWFGLSETVFSYFFAMNALLLMAAPKLYVMVKPRFRPAVILKTTLVVIFVASLLTAVIGRLSPIIFLVSFAPVALSSSFLRAFVTDMLLAQPGLNAGASVSTISFTNVALGAVGMLIASLFAEFNLVVVLGSIGICVSILSALLVWRFTTKGQIIEGYR
ncbi:MAG: MFS transporter [Pelistega sp.]|nr:MFS transporter [Pelistega sp.]